VARCCEAIHAVRGRAIPTPRLDHRVHCIRVESTWRQWICLFPQHGAGRKHARTIELLAWQQEIVDAALEDFLCGLIHTDGWRGVSRVHAKGRDYEYPRYQFSNRFGDIRALFTKACDKLGVSWRAWGRFHISVARRESVALLDTFVGPKR
jgi:hypothetical protein